MQDETNEIIPKSSGLMELNEGITRLREEMAKVIVGQHKMVDLLLTGLLCDGHILIEGVPGVAKTLAAKLVAKVIDVNFSRLQFTPDLMPSDVLGTSVFDPQHAKFVFKKGPVFSNIILIDEINRAPAKTQSALFEVMEERQVSIDGITHPMDYPFIVLATQNPIEQEGTYRLPEAQLDRFLFKIDVHYPTLEEEVFILTRQDGQSQTELLSRIEPILSATRLRHFRELIHGIFVEPKLINYIASIVNETRNHPSLYLGASTRASIALLKAGKATAAMEGRDFLIPEDIISVAPYVLRHRIMLSPEKEMEGMNEDDIINSILKSLAIPR